MRAASAADAAGQRGEGVGDAASAARSRGPTGLEIGPQLGEGHAGLRGGDGHAEALHRLGDRVRVRGRRALGGRAAVPVTVDDGEHVAERRRRAGRARSAASSAGSASTVRRAPKPSSSTARKPSR